ncbi:kdo(2)-lipid IV(A) palmitoleoyltransferase [Siccibacter colletis]|uniref:kdo(2)-lipid IV(A) palmitoleoyltransferase n=1 Tax=Siccibacter colletis TaxID=1505757 RepID=UPI003CE99286
MPQNFKTEFLHPRYWMTWTGVTILWLLVQLPYPLLVKLGRTLGRLARPFLKKREYVANRNLELCFPAMDNSSRSTLLTDNFTSLGMALIETGMAWFWSDARLRKHFDVEGFANLQRALDQGKGVMVVGVHFMSLELGGRVMGLCRPMMATYRPHNNPVLEFVQTRGRLRSNKAMIDRRNLKGLVSALKKGEAVWFAPDQDYGRKGSVFAPFFAMQNTATTNGTFVISRLSGAAMLTITMIRRKDNAGYRLYIGDMLTDYPSGNEQAAAGYINKKIEDEILRAPEQYLWVHRRFKTRPLGEAASY